MATLKGESIKVVGLKELVKELKKLDDTELVKALKDVNYAVAVAVIDTAQGIAGGLTRMQSKAAATLKPSKQAARAQVTGGTGIPYFGGAEFGSIKWKQFQPWRGNGLGAGYFLYPAIRGDTEKIIDMYWDAIEKIAMKAFPD